MSDSNYLADCRQILQAFELSQAQMLHLKYPTAQQEIQMEIKQMEERFTGMHKALTEKGNSSDKKYLILVKQLDRLLKFIKELHGQMSQMGQTAYYTEKEILFIFERQYKFKAIYKKHLSDFARIF